MDREQLVRALAASEIDVVTIAYRLRSRYGHELSRFCYGREPNGASQSPIGSGPDMDTYTPVSTIEHSRTVCHNRLSAPVPIWTHAARAIAKTLESRVVTIAYRLRSRYGR